MNEQDARSLVLRTLGRITPEADLESLEPDIEFREQLDIDSMDFLNFIIGLHEATGFDIPEADYGKLETLDSCVAYLGRIETVSGAGKDQ